MEIKLKVSPAEHVEWLKTFGHVHKDTIKLIEKMHDLLEQSTIYNLDEVEHFLWSWDKSQ